MENDYNDTEPRTEIIDTPEKRVAGVVKQAEYALMTSGKGIEPREPGQRYSACTLTPDVVRYYAEKEGLTNDTYQVADLHGSLGGQDYKNAAFTHAFGIVTANTKKFIVDLSYCQFLGDNGYIQAITSEKSGIENTHPLAQELLHKGFVALTDETLRQYLEITTRASNPPYIETASVAMLENMTPTKSPQFTDSELINKGYVNGSNLDKRYAKPSATRVFPPKVAKLFSRLLK